MNSKIWHSRIKFLILLSFFTLLATFSLADKKEKALSPLGKIKTSLAHIGIVQSKGEWIATQWLGTGFVVTDRCQIMTAKHILTDLPESSRLIARFLNPQDPESTRTFEATILAEGDSDDLAILEVQGGRIFTDLCKKSLTPLEPLAQMDAEALAGTEVLIAGFPVLEGEQPRDLPILRTGIVSSGELLWREQPMLLLDLTGVPGFSGAPVIRVSDHKVLGVVFGPGSTRRIYDFEWATPITQSRIQALQDSSTP